MRVLDRLVTDSVADRLFVSEPAGVQNLRNEGQREGQIKLLGNVMIDSLLCEPLGYLEFLSLVAGARLVITDSGGIQEETTALGIPCLTIRKNSERPIAVEVGTNTLVGQESNKLHSSLADILADRYKRGCVRDLWDGQASSRIGSAFAQGGAGGTWPSRLASKE